LVIKFGYVASNEQPKIHPHNAQNLIRIDHWINDKRGS
jgi:hypothetical protein